MAINGFKSHLNCTYWKVKNSREIMENKLDQRDKERAKLASLYSCTSLHFTPATKLGIPEVAPSSRVPWRRFRSFSVDMIEDK